MLYLAIPALNEAATIGVLLWRLRSVLAEFPREYEVVVYDDASSDLTSEVLEPYTKVLPLTVLRGERTVGYAGAIDALVRYVSRQTRYPRRDAMLLLQADFTDPPALVPEFAKRFEGGADMVIGERSQSVDTPVSVRRLLRVAPWVTRPFVRVQGVRDITSSFRLVRISVLRDLIRAAGDAPVCAGDELTANADFLLRTVPLARRVETLPVEPTFGVRTRETRRITMRDGIALARWAWRARGRRVAPSTAPESPGDNARSQRGDSKGDTRNDFRTDPRTDVRIESRPEVRVEAKHEPRLETRSSARGEARPNPRNDARREARRDARNETRKKERAEPRTEVPREYGNDQLYDLNAESRAVVAGAPTPADVSETDTLATPEERRSKRPRPKRRKRGQRQTLDADGNPIAVGDERAGASQTDDQADADNSDELSSSSAELNAEQGADGDVAESADGERAKRSPRKKRRKRGARRNRNADGTIAESADASIAMDGAEHNVRSTNTRDENDASDNDDSYDEDSSRGEDVSADTASASDGTDAPRARRRGRRGRRGGARRSRSTAPDGAPSNESGGDETRPSQNGNEPSGENSAT